MSREGNSQTGDRIVFHVKDRYCRSRDLILYDSWSSGLLVKVSSLGRFLAGYDVTMSSLYCLYLSLVTVSLGLTVSRSNRTSPVIVLSLFLGIILSLTLLVYSIVSSYSMLLKRFLPAKCLLAMPMIRITGHGIGCDRLLLVIFHSLEDPFL